MNKKIIRYTYAVVAFSYLLTSHWLLPQLVDNPGTVHEIICILLIIGAIAIAIYTIPKDELYGKVLLLILVLGGLGLAGYLFVVYYLQSGHTL